MSSRRTAAEERHRPATAAARIAGVRLARGVRGLPRQLRADPQCHPRARIEEERQHLRPLPARPLPAYRESYATVSRASAVRVLKHSYSVSSRLIGIGCACGLHADIVELHHRGERVAVMDRIGGKGKHKIDYRHIIHTLVRKPGAFRRYVFREALFPSLEFRRAYDALLAEGADQADLEYVRILHLAASDGEECVRDACSRQLLAAAIAPRTRRCAPRSAVRAFRKACRI
jgi:hypothetical protein